MKLKYFIILLWILAAGYNPAAKACTSAIISGRITADGRPIIWKNRDSSSLDNCIRHIKGEKYDFIAITGYSANPKSVWGGTNEAGFSIVNTLSYNLNEENGPKGNKNGSMMYRALEICQTVDDFRNYLDTIPHPILASANYGVMDSEGNAGYFETGNSGYTFFDINDPLVAPFGFMVRSNYSYSGRQEEGGGYLRHQLAFEKLSDMAATRQITPEWIFENLSRSFENPLMDIDLRSGILNKPNGSGWTTEQDFIARKSTSSAVVIQGVEKGRDPEGIVMWTAIGYPPVTPFVPLWVVGSDKRLPKAILSDAPKGKRSPLCDASNALRNRIYSFKRGNLTDGYFNWEMLFNSKDTGLMQRTESYEKEMLNTLNVKDVTDTVTGKVDKKKIFRIYDKIDEALAYFMNVLQP